MKAFNFLGSLMLLWIICLTNHLSQKYPEPKNNSGTAVSVSYSIEYGTIYTGDQTPVVYKGATKIPFGEYLYSGANGLPVAAGGSPMHSDLCFNSRNGKTILHIPTINEDEVRGLLETQDSSRMFMIVRVSKSDSGTFIISAYPDTASYNSI